MLIGKKPRDARKASELHFTVYLNRSTDNVPKEPYFDTQNQTVIAWTS